MTQSTLNIELKNLMLNKVEECHKQGLSISDMVGVMTQEFDLSDNLVWQFFHKSFLEEYGINKYMQPYK